MTIILKDNSNAIRAKIEAAGIKLCHCAQFVDADWLDYHTGITDMVHGNGYAYEGMTREETRALFLHELKEHIFCKDVDEFIEKIKEYDR